MSEPKTVTITQEEYDALRDIMRANCGHAMMMLGETIIEVDRWARINPEFKKVWAVHRAWLFKQYTDTKNAAMDYSNARYSPEGIALAEGRDDRPPHLRK